jgi:hypothetical protein
MGAKKEVKNETKTAAVASATASGATGAAGDVKKEEPTKAKVRVHHRQWQRQLDKLTAMRVMLDGLDGVDEAFRTAMTAAGLGPDFLADAATKLIKAEQAVDARHEAQARAMAQTEVLAEDDYQARAAYSAFRQVARLVVTNGAGRMALKLDERVPQGLAGFRHHAETALSAAEEEPYASQLAAATFGPERIAALRGMLAGLLEAADAQAEAQHAARHATAVRDVMVRDALLAGRQIRVEVSVLLRRYRHLSAPQGFGGI